MSYDDRYPYPSRCPRCGKYKDVPFSSDDPDCCRCTSNSQSYQQENNQSYQQENNPTTYHYHDWRLPYGMISSDEEIVGKIGKYDLVELDGVTKPDFSVPAYHQLVVRYNGRFFLRYRGSNWLVTDPRRATTFDGPDHAEYELEYARVI